MHRDHRSETRGIVISMLRLVDGKLRALETAAISGKQGLWRGRERPNPSMTGMQPAAKLFMGICPAFRPQLFQSSSLHGQTRGKLLSTSRLSTFQRHPTTDCCITLAHHTISPPLFPNPGIRKRLSSMSLHRPYEPCMCF
jgi:hypothetical protein